jgi:glycerol uptake facilitator-like aquaporin
LLANTAATGAALLALIAALGPLSGGHVNLVVTLADRLGEDLSWGDVRAYIVAQVAGGFRGTAVANLMFETPVFSLSRHARAGPAQLFSEVVATFGLVLIIGTCARRRPSAVPLAVASYISAAYWFTASTSFANPAVTLARAVSDSFAGSRPVDSPWVHRGAGHRRGVGRRRRPVVTAAGSRGSGTSDDTLPHAVPVHP